MTPTHRIRLLRDAPPNPGGAFVVYWMTSARRTRWNFGLQRAAELARELRRPLVVLEALRCDYPHASERLHRFVIDGMASNAAGIADRAFYYPYVEPEQGHGRGLLRALAARACAVVTDDYPAFFLPSMLKAAVAQVACRFEAIDSNGLIPLSLHGRAFPTARGYRAFVQRELRGHLRTFPEEDPLDGLPAPAAPEPSITSRWAPSPATISLAGLSIDHAVRPVALEGGRDAGVRLLKAFVSRKLARYADEHNHPDADATSRLSPYLHFGHLSAHEVFSAVMTHERWTTRRLAGRAGGAREGWCQSASGLT